MKTFNQVSEITEKELFEGFHARLVHTEKLTIAHFRIEAGSVLPEHAHHHEQVTNVLSGELEMTIGGQSQVCTAGTTVIIPSHVPHSGRALTECRVIDVFQPVREDYR